ncbi:MAG: glycoside hydrolase family 15 protein [Nevskia sp.]|nr:glycoside hydrolase family 15 protein [Nevskia sp.]
MSQPLDHWLAAGHRQAAAAMLASISPVGIVKSRPGFGQTVHAVPGSIVASPVLASYDPDPDYFFHWYRDSAVVIDALRLLYRDATVGQGALAQVADFVSFSLVLGRLDGRALAASPEWRAAAAPDFVRFLRDDAELAAVHGEEAVAAETRVNPDGTLDISRWARPQHDGPPLRALAVLRWLRTASFESGAEADAARLIRADLAFTLHRWRQPSFDIWEEEPGQHYYTLRVSAAALEEGAAWMEDAGQLREAQPYRAASEAIRHLLDGFWLEGEGYYRSRILPSGARSPKELDIAVILAAIHAGGEGGPHTVHDPRLQATLTRLEDLFDTAYPINRNRPPHTRPAMGRYPGDVYYSGGAYYFSTLGAAEFCYRAAAGADAGAWIERGDGFLATVRAHTPANGELSEQFDQRTGAQTSARHLAWSYAALISCAAARRAALDQAG